METKIVWSVGYYEKKKKRIRCYCVSISIIVWIISLIFIKSVLYMIYAMLVAESLINLLYLLAIENLEHNFAIHLQLKEIEKKLNGENMEVQDIEE